MKDKTKSIFGILFVIFLFVLSSYLIQRHTDFFYSYLDVGFLGMLVFMFIVIVSIVFAPVSAAPLFPIAAGLWGWFIAGLLGAAGWTIGAVIAFVIARRYGVGLVKKVVPMSKLYKYESKIPSENLFMTVVFLRMVIPFDGVSYLFGLFSKMTLKSFTLATLIGLIPFSLTIAYLGSVPFYVTIIVVLVAVAVIGIISLVKRK